jgi:transposase
MSSRQVAASLGIGATTVIDFLGRVRRAGIAWPLPDDLDDEVLEARLFLPRTPPVKAALRSWG